MKLAWLFINLLAYIISTETHALKRARGNSACPPYPCLPGQTSMSPCPSACCTTEAITPEVMIPCSVAPTANPIVQCPCGCCCENTEAPRDPNKATAPSDKVTGGLFLWNSKAKPSQSTTPNVSNTQPTSPTPKTQPASTNPTSGNQPTQGSKGSIQAP